MNFSSLSQLLVLKLFIFINFPRHWLAIFPKAEIRKTVNVCLHGSAKMVSNVHIDAHQGKFVVWLLKTNIYKCIFRGSLSYFQILIIHLRLCSLAIWGPPSSGFKPLQIPLVFKKKYSDMNIWEQASRWLVMFFVCGRLVSTYTFTPSFVCLCMCVQHIHVCASKWAVCHCHHSAFYFSALSSHKNFVPHAILPTFKRHTHTRIHACSRKCSISVKNSL